MEDNAPPVDQFWAFFFCLNFFLQFVQLFTINIRINRIIAWKEIVTFCFWVYIWWIRRASPWSFSFKIIVDDQFIIPSYKWVRKKWWFFSRLINKLPFPVRRVSWASVSWPRRVRHPNVESVDMINFVNMVNNNLIWDLKITSNVLSSQIRTFVH